jgi:hypothetical protein
MGYHTAVDILGIAATKVHMVRQRLNRVYHMQSCPETEIAHQEAMAELSDAESDMAKALQLRFFLSEAANSVDAT